MDSGQIWGYADQPGYPPIREGLDLLCRADVLIGHNIIKYDLPTLRRLYPSFNPRGLVRDTLTISRLIWTDVETEDHRRRDRGLEFPGTLIGSHSLKAWGYRLGVLKGLFNESTDWSVWTPQMQAYCEQDVEVTHALWTLIEKQQYSEEAIQLEHDFQEVIFLQEKHGFRFDEQAAGKLAATLLQRREELTTELQKAVPARIEQMKTPEYWAWVNPFDGSSYKANTKGGLRALLKEKNLGTKGLEQFIKPGPNKQKVHPFNPGSRDQCAAYLISKGWTPTKFTETGKPQVDETTLDGLDVPAAKLLTEFFVVNKLLGQLSEGDNAWLKLSRKGRIFGEVITNGAVTSRCAHMKPNVSQVPAVVKNKAGEILMAFLGRWGFECRSLFMADEGDVLVDSDASGLEIRNLAHFMARYDNGAYGKIVLEGDIHSVNQQAAGIDTRANAKTWFYSYLYGAGNHKLGVNAGGVKPDEMAEWKAHKDVWAGELRQLRRKAARDPRFKFTEKDVALCTKGAVIRKRFETKLSAVSQLKEALDAACKRGYLVGLDGRRLHIRSRHASLNTLLQAAGAVLVKKATVILHAKLKSLGLVVGRDFSQVGHIHDEVVLTVKPHHAELVASCAKESFSEAGRHFRFRIPIDGGASIGKTWAEVH